MKLEQTLNNREKGLYKNYVKAYRKSHEYIQVTQLDKNCRYNPKVVAEKIAQSYAKLVVLKDRELNSEIGYRKKYFKQQFWDAE